MSSCGDCKNKLSRDDRDKLRCDGCAKFFHGRCVRVSPAVVKDINDQKKSWKCLDCGERRLSMSTGAVIDTLGVPKSASAGDSDLIASITELKKDMDWKLDSIRNNVDGFQKALERLEQVAKNCVENRKVIDAVEVRVSETERNLLLDTVELHGVPPQVWPKDAEEKFTLAAKFLQSTTGVSTSADAIDDCFIVKKKNGNNQTVQGPWMKQFGL
ncbi:hypothetical protein DMENIID0001_001080 [Sergentomyia squamirostris]